MGTLPDVVGVPAQVCCCYLDTRMPLALQHPPGRGGEQHATLSRRAHVS